VGREEKRQDKKNERREEGGRRMIVCQIAPEEHSLSLSLFSLSLS